MKMKQAFFISLILLLNVVHAEEPCDVVLSSAQWAYDKSNHTLRLCVKSVVKHEPQCTTFPIQVFIEGERPYEHQDWGL